MSMFQIINPHILPDGVIKVWDYSTGEPGKLLRSVREHDGWVTSFLFWLVMAVTFYLNHEAILKLVFWSRFVSSPEDAI